MLIVGLTGGIASGKSSAVRIFERLGARIVDSDVLARRVVEPGMPALQKIRDRFGDEVLTDDGMLDRERLRDVVFTDDRALTDLNAIVHPAVYEEIVREIEEYRRNPRGQILILDIPLLFESGGESLVDAVVVVYVDRETQIQRLRARDKFSREETINRIEKQLDLEEKKRRADFVVDNTGSFDDLERNVRAVFGKLMAQSG
jgi:dephospho-CoA kinase